MIESDVYAAMSRAEDQIAKRVAERALKVTDENHKRALRMAWRMASERAEHLANLAVETRNDGR